MYLPYHWTRIIRIMIIIIVYFFKFYGLPLTQRTLWRRGKQVAAAFSWIDLHLSKGTFVFARTGFCTYSVTTLLITLAKYQNYWHQKSLKCFNASNEISHHLRCMKCNNLLLKAFQWRPIIVVLISGSLQQKYWKSLISFILKLSLRQIS